MQEFFRDLTHNYLVMGGGFAGLCGALSYLLKVEEGKEFKWHEFLLHTAISMVAGLIAFEIFTYHGFPPELSGALSGTAGWAGTRIVRIIEILLERRTAKLLKEKLDKIGESEQ